ncbi:MAG TPA: DUF805 domain-containing protein, partial [Vicinamibacteria bacterium]|nr:DUF805 domain-containing protein [Vicinamibacteria bacterium]
RAVRRLGPGTLVWREGMADWMPPEAVPELAAAPLPPSAAGAEPPTLNPLVLWKRCFAWGGRFSRSEFAVAHLGFSLLGAMVIGVVAVLLAAVAGEDDAWAMVVVGALVLVWTPLAFAISLGSTVRRLHDLGQSGWLAVLSFVPCVNVLFLVYLLAAPSQTTQAAAPASGPLMAVVAVVAVLFLIVPMIGIVAAIAIPSLLRARISANEASAIGSVRTVVSAQAAYQSANQGAFDGRWECLAGPQDCIPGYAGPSFLEAGLFAGPRSGYVHELMGGGRAGAGPGRSASSADGFAVIAYPAEPGKSGIRAFCGDATFRVCALSGGGREDLLEGAAGEPGLRCSAACRDLS